MTAAGLGEFALAAAVLSCGLAVLAALAAVRQERPGLLRAGRRALYVAAGLLSACMAVLLAAILRNDFQLSYVAEYSERAMPLGYKVAALWAGQEGSLLLWGWLLAVLGAVAAFTRRREQPVEQATLLVVLAAAGGFFAATMLFAADANPFRTQPLLPDGHGMNPMLQNPAMVFHPPVLFLGYAGFAIPFAYALAALVAGRSDGGWARAARPWVLTSWLFLSAGILLGAEWAYEELGWGGYWSWDPVENASLLPWLAGTALLHSLMVQQRRRMLKGWTAGLMAATFLLCLTATYLTRSGVIASMHTFSESPIGWFFLVAIAVGAAASVALLLWRRGLLRAEHRLEHLLSREMAVLGANVLLTAMLLATLIGTIYPLISGLWSKEPILLGPPFYNHVVLPMGLGVLALMAAGPLLGYVRSAALRRRATGPGLAAVLAAVLTAVLIQPEPWAMAAAAVTAFALVAMGADVLRSLNGAGDQPDTRASSLGRQVLANHRHYGALTVHLGMLMILVGIAGSSLFGSQKDLVLRAGQPAGFGGYTIALESAKESRGANYSSLQTVLVVTDAHGGSATVRPELRTYAKWQQQTNSEVAIRSTLPEDLYLVLTQWQGRAGQASVKAFINPLVVWIWIGGVVLCVGSLLCLAPLPRRAAAERTNE